jgi:hypothetical protein
MMGSDPAKPLSAKEARKSLRRCIEKGSVIWTRHVRQRMDERDLVEPDIVNVLRCGRVEADPEWVNWHWRYQVKTDRMTVVVTFEPEEGEPTELVIVTAWREGRRGT